MRLVTFIIALLLLAGSVDPTRGWLITLVVVSGLAAVRWRTWAPFSFRPAIDLRLVTFVIAVLLLAGTIDPTRDWLIVLSVISGLALFTPRIFGMGGFDGMLPAFGFGPFSERHGDRMARRFERRYRRHWRRWSGWDSDWDWDAGWGDEQR
jgi:hypothetical protein